MMMMIALNSLIREKEQAEGEKEKDAGGIENYFSIAKIKKYMV